MATPVLGKGSVKLAASTAEAQTSIRQRARLSRGGRGSTREFAHILREDPALAEALAEERRADLERALRAPVIEFPLGGWSPPRFDPRRTYGLLLLDGLIGRRLVMPRAASMELVRHGDILRPWQHPLDNVLDAAVEWLVLSPARLAVLDERVTATISQSPELVVAFAARLVRRWQAAAQMTAIAHMGRVEDRLLAVLWLLAEDWGRVTPQGVRLSLRLKHHLLGELIGARRPSVTLGLRHLRERGDVITTEDGSLLLRSRSPGSAGPETLAPSASADPA